MARILCGPCMGSGQRYEWKDAELVQVFPNEVCPTCGGSGIFPADVAVDLQRATAGIMRFRRAIEAERRRNEFRVIDGTRGQGARS